MRRLMYALRRANGRWFELHRDGRRRVPVFLHEDRAWRARQMHPELVAYAPAPLDEKALEELATADMGAPIGFWLVDEAAVPISLRHGRPLEFLQLAALEGAGELPHRSWIPGQSPDAKERFSYARAAASAAK